MSWLATFLGKLFKELIPSLFAEWRKPRKVKQGGDKHSKDAVDDFIRGAADDSDAGVQSDSEE